MQRPRLLAFALAAAGLVANTAPAAAQAGGGPPAAADSGHRMLDPVSRLLGQRDELKITDEQATRLEAIRTRYLETHQGQLEDLRRDREKRAAFRAGMDSLRTEVLAVLTPEQQKQVGEMRKKWRREQWGGKHGGRPGEHHRHGEVAPDSAAD